MNADELRELQGPVKSRYRENPSAAKVTYSVAGQVLLDQLQCNVPSTAGPVSAGLHPAAGGDGSQACSADMLLQALVACGGVTLAAVATAMSVPIHSAHVKADAEMDFRGTLAVDRSVPVGLQSLRVEFIIDSPASDQELAKLVELTERYCVVLQTVLKPPALHCEWSRRISSET